LGHKILKINRIKYTNDNVNSTKILELSEQIFDSDQINRMLSEYQCLLAWKD